MPIRTTVQLKDLLVEGRNTYADIQVLRKKTRRKDRTQTKDDDPHPWFDSHWGHSSLDVANQRESIRYINYASVKNTKNLRKDIFDSQWC